MENDKSVASSTRGAKVGGGGRGGSQPSPQNLEGGSRGVELPLILRDCFLIDHIYYYVQFISIAIHGGGGGVAPLKLIQLYSLCMFIYIGNLKSGIFIT